MKSDAYIILVTYLGISTGVYMEEIEINRYMPLYHHTLDPQIIDLLDRLDIDMLQYMTAEDAEDYGMNNDAIGEDATWFILNGTTVVAVAVAHRGCGDDVFLYQLFVRKAYRRLGCGKALCNLLNLAKMHWRKPYM